MTYLKAKAFAWSFVSDFGRFNRKSIKCLKQLPMTMLRGKHGLFEWFSRLKRWEASIKMWAFRSQRKLMKYHFGDRSQGRPFVWNVPADYKGGFDHAANHREVCASVAHRRTKTAGIFGRQNVPFFTPTSLTRIIWLLVISFCFQGWTRIHDSAVSRTSSEFTNSSWLF
jgi:hypothetical protein